MQHNRSRGNFRSYILRNSKAVQKVAFWHFVAEALNGMSDCITSNANNLEPAWRTTGGTRRNMQQTVETRHESRITTSQKWRNAGNTAKSMFLMELVSFVFIAVLLAYA